MKPGLWRLDRRTGRYLGHIETLPQNVFSHIDADSGRASYRPDIAPAGIGDPTTPVWTHNQRAMFMTGALATAGGLVFIGDLDRYFKAFDVARGFLPRLLLPDAVESRHLRIGIVSV